MSQSANPVGQARTVWPPETLQRGCIDCVCCWLLPLQAARDCALQIVDKDSSIETFWVQVFISLTLIIFTIVMLATGHDTSVYLPILSATVGYWLPAPARKAPASAVDSSVAAAGGSQMTVPNSADGEGPHPTHNNGASGSPAPRPNTPPDHERMPLRNDIEEARAAAH